MEEGAGVEEDPGFADAVGLAEAEAADGLVALMGADDADGVGTAGPQPATSPRASATMIVARRGADGGRSAWTGRTGGVMSRGAGA